MTIRPGAMPEQFADDSTENGQRHEIQLLGQGEMAPPGMEGEAPTGSAIEDPAMGDWYTNLLPMLAEEEAKTVSSDIWEMIQDAKESNSSRDELIRKGIEMLGLDRFEQTRDTPFPGATAIRHPLFAMACTEFASRSMAELMPVGGPAKGVVVVDDPDGALQEKADRVAGFENWQVTTQISEFVSEQDRCFAMLGIEGECFTRMWFDPARKRPMYSWLPGEQVPIPYDSADEQTAPIVPVVLKLWPSEVRGHISGGLWADHDVSAPMAVETSRAQEKIDRATGQSQATTRAEELRKLTYYECTVRMSVPSLEPNGESEWLVALDHQSQKLVAIRRNWRPDDATRQRIRRVFRWVMFPGRGRGWGYMQLIGGLGYGATGALRGLLDSATKQNAGGGLMAKQAMPKGKTELRYGPGQYVPVETIGMQRVQDAIYQPDAAGPSPVLFELMGSLQDLASRFGTVALQDMVDETGNTPVGTTLARVEEGSRIYGQVFRRLHNTMRMVLQELHEINREHIAEQLKVWDFAGEPVQPEDFDRTIDVELVSDPKTFSHVQRQMRAQMMLDVTGALSERGVEVDQREVALEVWRAAGLDNVEKILPPPKDAFNDAMPWKENAAVAQDGKLEVNPEGDDHLLHWQIHLAMIKLPTVAQSPGGQGLLAHMFEHAAGFMDLAMMKAQGAMQGMDPMMATEQMQAVQKQAVQFYSQMLADLGPALVPAEQKPVQDLADAEKAKVEAKMVEIQANTDAKIQIIAEELKADKQKLLAELTVKLEELDAKRQGEREKNASSERMKAADLAADQVKLQQAEQRQDERFAKEQDREDFRSSDAQDREDVRNADAEDRSDMRTGQERDFQRELRKGEDDDE